MKSRANASRSRSAACVQRSAAAVSSSRRANRSAGPQLLVPQRLDVVGARAARHVGDLVRLAPRVHPGLVVGVHEVARRVRPVGQRAFDAGGHVRIQLAHQCTVAAVAQVVPQRDDPAWRAVGGVVVDAAGLDDVRQRARRSATRGRGPGTARTRTRIARASSKRPVASVAPGSAMKLSRPQYSLNHGNPAKMPSPRCRVTSESVVSCSQRSVAVRRGSSVQTKWSAPMTASMRAWRRACQAATSRTAVAARARADSRVSPTATRKRRAVARHRDVVRDAGAGRIARHVVVDAVARAVRRHVVAGQHEPQPYRWRRRPRSRPRPGRRTVAASR